MKKVLFTAALLIGSLSIGFSAEEKIEGKITCLKCDCKKSDECTDVIISKGVTYIIKGEGDKGFHKTICKGGKEGSVTGEVSEEGGKKIVTIKAAPELKK